MTTISLETWWQHIETAQAHGLSRHALYSANKTLRKRAGANPTPANLPAATPFITVQVTPPSYLILQQHYARA